VRPRRYRALPCGPSTSPLDAMFTNAVVLVSFGVLAVTIMHAAIGNWSGGATLGNALALVFSVPYLAIRSWQLRALRVGDPLSRIRWWLMATFPVLFAAFWLAVTVYMVTSHGV